MTKLALSLFLVCCYTVVTPLAGDPTGTKCEAVAGAPSCVCRSPKGVVNLTKIANFDGTARFARVMDSDGFAYDYNPCAGFTGPYECVEVQVCKHSPTGYAYAIASVGSETMWIDTDGKVYAYYGAGPGEVFVHLTCDTSKDKDPTLTIITDSPKYEFNLTSCYACPGGCPAEKGESSTRKEAYKHT